MSTADDPGRRIPHRLALPTGRAIVGGLLVAVSGLGIFAAHRAATTDDQTNWLVVARPVNAGEAITVDDLALAPMDLADLTEARAVRDPDDVIGRIALVPLAAGDLVLSSTTAERTAEATTAARRIGLALDAADALGGDLAVGDRVDVLSVPSSGSTTDPTSQVIVRGALVTAVGVDQDAAVGSVDHLQLNLDVPDEESARRVVDAHAAGGVTLISASTMAIAGTDAP